jgi:predicted kinase
MVRAAAARLAPLEKVKGALVQEGDTVVVRAAAASLAAHLGLPLTQEGSLVPHTSLNRPDVLFVDIDGTLLDGATFRDHESIESLQRAREEGVVVVVVTGRTAPAFTGIAIEADLAVCKGLLFEPKSRRVLAKLGDKGNAVTHICELLNAAHPVAVGDGRVDTAMFEAVRSRGGRCGWVLTGQDAPAVHATDLLGPVGTGGVGRFVDDLMAYRARSVVPRVRPAPEVSKVNYASQVLPLRTFRTIVQPGMLSEDWQLAHGHVTTAYPDDPSAPLPTPRPDAVVEVYGKVVTERVSAFAVRIDGEDRQPNGTPLHITVGLAPQGKGKFTPPVAAGPAVEEAIATGTLEVFSEPFRVPTVAVRAGLAKERMDEALEMRVASSAAPVEPVMRALNAGISPHEITDPRRPLVGVLESRGAPASGLVVLVGPPAAGKSTFAAKLPNSVVVSLDSIRQEINGHEASQARLGDVIAMAEARMSCELSLGRLVVADATNLEAKVLLEHVQRAHRFNLPAIAVYLPVTLEEAIERDRQRHLDGRRSIGLEDGEWSAAKTDRVMRKMFNRWDSVRTRLLDGDHFGFDHVVRAEQ